MQLKRNIAILAIAALAFTSPAWGQSASTLLQEGIFIEETVGNLDAAIKIYEKIVDDAKTNQTYAALAQYRLGMCYQKKGNNDEAAASFEKLLRVYPDEHKVIAQARAQLAALGHPISAVVTRQVWAPALDNMGEVSPDGRYISYVNWTKGNLAVHDIKTGENKDLTDEGTWETPNKFCDVSIWSPDSQHIAYYWIDRGTGSQLRIVGRDGSNTRVLARSKTVDGHVPWPRAWSKDGKHILALYGKKDESLEQGYEGRIVMVSVADGSIRVLKSLGEQHCERVSISPDGRYVAYELEPKHGSEERDIHLLATDGSSDVPLVVHPANDGDPFWTPDGKRIVFLSNRSGSNGLWMLDVEDGKPKGLPTQVKDMGSRCTPMGLTPDGSFYFSANLPALDIHVATLDFEAGEVVSSPVKKSLRFEGTNFTPAWSPDGKYLAYASRRSLAESYILVIQSVESGQERDLSPKSVNLVGAHAFQAPQWSPDGRSILVAGRTAVDDFGLYLVDVQTGDATLIVKFGRTSQMRWSNFSKDGKQIYFVRDRSIIAHDLATHRENELYKTNDYLYRLACSPDGQQLAFCEGEQAVYPNVLKTISVSGGKPRELFALKKEGKRFPRGVGLSWTPDGHNVIVGRPYDPDKPDELWSIPATGGEPRKLNLGVKVRSLSLHPDGQRISFTTGKNSGAIWVIENFLPVDKNDSIK